MNTKNAAYTITLTQEQFKALQRGESVTIQPPKPEPKKWEPVVGDYLVDANGSVVSSAAMGVDADSSAVIFGATYKTKEQAEKARDAMAVHNRLLAYVAEFDPDFVPDWGNAKQDKFYVYQEGGRWNCSYVKTCRDASAVYMSWVCAQGLVDKLNSGEVVL